MIWPSEYWNKNIYTRCDKPEFIIEYLIEQTQELYKNLNEPLVEWSEFENRPMAKVLLKWEEMENLTKHGDTTKLTYIFGTKDKEVGSNENFKLFYENVDILWWCGFSPQMTSLKHIGPDYVQVNCS